MTALNVLTAAVNELSENVKERRVAREQQGVVNYYYIDL